MLKWEVYAIRRVGGLLQEGRSCGGECQDVDGDSEALGREDGVHEGNVLRGGGRGCGED